MIQLVKKPTKTDPIELKATFQYDVPCPRQGMAC
jgi:hypothetical protein